jgi:osmotically-inducible protein OsmY
MKKFFIIIALGFTALSTAESQKPVSDPEITQEIHDSIGSGWFSKGYEDVSFDVRNGIVYLRGTVDTLENRKKVEDSVIKIEGVRQVNNQIAISKQGHNAYSDPKLRDFENSYPQDSAFSQQDRQINAKIRDKIGKYETFTIKTANGIVIISGAIDKPEEAEKISAQIKEIEGVKSVNNQLVPKNR